MCVIFHLLPGALPKKEHLYNAVYNNWHGYGLILKDGNGHLQVIKKCPEKGNDPEEIWDLLEDNKDIERFLHVRYSTRGSAGEENTQPFSIYNSNKRQVWFMHNGTLHSYGSSTTNAGQSDTAEFCEKILTPSLIRWDGENGKADYTDPLFNKLIVDKHWSNISKGLFISNDLNPLKIGSGWSEYKQDDEEAPKIFVSNTDYFNSLQRGPEFTRRETLRKEEEAAKRMFHHQNGNSSQNTQTSTSDKSAIKQWNGSNVSKSTVVLKALNDIICTWDLDDAKDVAKLTNVSYDEWVRFIEDEGEYCTAALIERLTQHIRTLAIQNRTLFNTKQKAQVRIKELMEEKKENANKKAA